MSTSGSLRADALRNRERLIDAARALFLAGGSTVALDAVARAAGVGIGTLYRHFPTRDALLNAVYRSEMEALEAEVDGLLAMQPAAEGLRQWMDSYARFVATKHAMHGTLRPALAPALTGKSETRSRVATSVAKFIAAGAVDGSLRTDMAPDDIAVTLAAMVLMTVGGPDVDQTRRLLDLLMDGLRT